jgi:tetratricopeptide (TPR) repeat protein
MKVRSTVLLLSLFWLVNGLSANDVVDRAHKYEDAGDSAAAREVYSRALRATPNDPEILTGYAQVLERYKDPGAREAWRKSAGLWKNAGRTQDAIRSARRAVLLDLIAGDRASTDADFATFSALGGTGLDLPGSAAGGVKKESILIPGPIRSFARMSAISADIHPDDVLAALARNVVTNGYQASHANELMEETEFLKLVHRYLSQARELDALAGPDKVIKIETCESTQTNDLLRTLGYRMRGACGSEVVLETVNAPRAFITTDSGFPLAELEAALRTDKPFSYDYHPSRATILYTPDYWLSARERTQGDFIDAFLSDPGLCRFYLGMAKLDPETAEALKNTVSPVRLRAVASVLDFFGGNFEIRQGKAIVPGGAKSAGAWADLTGVSPDKGAEFFEKLMIKDDGWLASLYDSLARMHGPVEEYLTDPARMKRYYTAVRGRVTTPGPARPVFQSNTEMMLLTTRLHVDTGGRVHIPGGLDVWRDLFQRNPRGKYDAKLSKAAVNWKDGDDVVEALFALCRKPVDNEPLKIFMALSDLDRNREQPLKPETVQRLIRGFTAYGAQYVIFNDAPRLSDRTIVAWLDNAEAVDKAHDSLFRQDLLGTLQGLTGVWQIFCRQGSIPADKADEALLAIVAPSGAPFAAVRNARDLFDVGRAGVTALLKSAGAASTQDSMLGLLAGGPRMDDSESRAELVQQERRIFEAQKLLPIDLLFDMADNLQAVSKGEKLNAQLASRLAARVADIDLPRSSMSGVEKNAMAFGYYVDKHVDDERKLNLRAIIDKASKDPEKLKDIRGQLAPALRDTLVGYNYLHYAPPGAQILITNPLFVRGHDFLGIMGANHSWRTTEVYGTGWPSNAGGRLVGSLSGLPYALAEAEQNFLIPTQTQALIWGDLVPQMMLTARASRFWTVTPSQMHWVGMHMRLTEELVAEAAVEPAGRDEVSQAVYRMANPSRASFVMSSIAAGDVRSALDALTPSEMYAIADGIAQTKSDSASPEILEIAHLRSLVPDQVSEAAISRAWGTPKPTLANSYHQELLNLRTFPTLMGYSSRIMAESWESNLLYWADVGDQMGILPPQLNVLVPEWTQKVVERIFASHLEDWPALLKSVRSVGEEVRVQNTQVAANSERPGN